MYSWKITRRNVESQRSRIFSGDTGSGKDVPAGGAGAAEDVAEEEQIDKSTVYRTLEKAYDDLAVLFFGIEGVKSIEVNRKTKKSGKKTMRNADTRNLANAKKAH